MTRKLMLMLEEVSYEEANKVPEKVKHWIEKING